LAEYKKGEKAFSEVFARYFRVVMH